MWGCWHEMLAINIKVGMSTHAAEGTLHRFPPEFPSKSRVQFHSTIMHHNGEIVKESSNEVGISKSYPETQLILTSPLTKYINESSALVHIVTPQITSRGMHSTSHGKKNKSGE